MKFPSVSFAGLSSIVSVLKGHPRFLMASTIVAGIAAIMGFVADGASLLQLMFKSDKPAVAAADPAQPAAPGSPAASTPTANPASAVGFNYMRMFGAMQVPALMAGLKDGGFTDVTAEGGKLKKLGLEIGGQVPAFFQKWEYRDAQPLNSPLWQRVSAIGSMSTYFEGGIPSTDPAERKRCSDYLFLEEGDDGAPSFAFKCDVELSRNAGFLFLLIENKGKDALDKLTLTYLDVDPADNPSLWWKYNDQSFASVCQNPSEGAVRAAGYKSARLETRTLPYLAAGRSYLWTVAVYRADKPKSFGGVPIDRVQLPICVSVNGAPSEPIRSPLREKAITVEVPNGWYWQ